MDRAYNKYGNEVYIDAAIDGEPYYCPFCQQALSLRNKGTIREHCFAHYPVRSSHSSEYSKCTETWHYDMSEWHKEWQRRFPEENRERIITDKDGKRHIADVLIGDTVIEFQSSGISTAEFRERNEFYNKCGYNVIWLFNIQEEINSGTIEYSDCQNNRNIRWSFSRLRSPFKDLRPNKEGATVYLEFPVVDDVTPNIDRLLYVNGYKRLFETSINNYTVKDFLHYLQNDPSGLIPQREKDVSEEDASRLKDAGGKTVYELWKKEYKSMVVHNMSTGKEMIVYGKGGELSFDHSYGKEVLKGQYTWKDNGRYKYSGEYFVVKNAEKPIWTLKYAKKRDFEAEEAEKKRIKEEALARQKAEEERLRLQIEKERQEEERRKAEEEAQRHKLLREAMEKKAAYDKYMDNIEEHINSEDTLAIDPFGTRWIKCRKCGRIATEEAFWTYGGRGSLNYGLCYGCSDSK